MKSNETLEAIRSVPASLQLKVTSEFLDMNGHMNVRHYFDIQDRALTEMMEAYDLNEGYLERTGNSSFTLEQHITYLDECLEGDDLSVHIRVVALGDRVIHTVNHLVNNTRGTLSQIFENVIGHTNLDLRRLTPWPDDIREQLAALVDPRTPELVPLSGRIGVR